MMKARDPDVLEWGRKFRKAKKTKKIVRLVKSMNPPVNISHTAYIVMLNMAAVDYTKLLKGEEE